MINPSDLRNSNANGFANPNPDSYTCVSYLGSGGDSQMCYLNPQRVYTLAHDSKDLNRNTDTNDIFIATSGNAVTNLNLPTGTLKQVTLIAGRAIAIGPNISQITWRNIAGGPTFALVPSSQFSRVNL